MSYDKIIGLEEYFQDSYDMIGANENKIWKRFIPTKQFFEVLKETLNSIESKDMSKRKSIWLQGTYGTGKSHATSVIKHLLSDDLPKINDYMEKIKDSNIQIYHRLSNFRENHRVFPIVLKGVSLIVNNRTLLLEIEKTIEKELEKEGLLKDFITQNDFDKYIQQLESNKFDSTFLDKIIKDDRIFPYVRTKEDLIDKLKKRDNDMLSALEDIFSKEGIYFIHSSIRDYLENILNELTNKKRADILIIFWDEFTAVLESQQGSTILSEIQNNIAELSNIENIFVFLTTHRKPHQAKIPTADMEKVRDRFKILDYSMEPFTTYHLIGASIKKKNNDEWKNIKDKKIKDVEEVIQKIIDNDPDIKKNVLEYMFPIHPFTAALSVLIARHIGSTERSIFKFLNDDNKGFIKFIKDNPNIEGKYFLTPEYLWDFFYEEFERKDNNTISSVLQRFRLHLHDLESKGKEYVAMFKGILLLNILYRLASIEETSLFSPSKENLLLMFKGNEYKTPMEEVLTFIDSDQIVSKTPDNLYLLTGALLPHMEINKEIQRLKIEINNKDIIDIFDGEDLLEKILFMFNSDIREVTGKIFDANIKVHNLRDRLEKFKSEHQHAVHLAIFIGRDQQALEQIKKTVNDICKEEEFKNIVFVIISKLLSEDVLDRYVRYWANANVARYHNYENEEKENRKYAKQELEGWVNKLNDTYLDWFIITHSGTSLVSRFKDVIKDKISKIIFPFGLENIFECGKNSNVWIKKKAFTSCDNFLSANDRVCIEEKTKKGPERYLREILRDNNKNWIVDNDLNFNENVDESHPLKKMDVEITRRIDEAKNNVFNLGKTLSFLSKPPYGIYPNMVCMAAVGFLMRKYIGKFYEANTGKLVNNATLMSDKIKRIFEFFEKGDEREADSKLDVRIGTSEEEKLNELLLDVFSLSIEDKNITKVRWGIIEWIKNNSCPIWAYKLSEKSNENINKAIDCIFGLTQNINKEISREDIEYYLENIKNVKYDLRAVLKDDGKNLFKKWLIEKVENVKINEEEMDDVTSYLERHMQEEISLWTEEKVKLKVKDWQLEKFNDVNKSVRVALLENKTNETKTYNEKQQPFDTNVDEKSIREIRLKIEEWDKEKIKELLFMMLENYSGRHHLIPFTKECIKKLENGRSN